MKRALPIAFVAVMFLLLGRIWSDLKATAQQGQGATADTPYWCGDANHDKNLDLSDAVYILNFLFTGGQAPVCQAEDLCAVAFPELDGRVTTLESAMPVVDARVATLETEVATLKGLVLTPEQRTDVWASRSAPQTIPDANTLVEFDEKSSDPLGEFDTTTHVFTAKNAGTYLVVAWANWQGTSPQAVGTIYLYKNGTWVANDGDYTEGTYGFGTTLSACIPLQAGDTLFVNAHAWTKDTSSSTLGTGASLRVLRLF